MWNVITHTWFSYQANHGYDNTCWTAVGAHEKLNVKCSRILAPHLNSKS